MFNLQLKFITVAVLFWLGLSVGRAGTIVFTQPPTPSNEGYTTWESESISGEVLARTYDNFTLESDASVDVVLWEGLYINTDGGANPAKADATSFEISFWSNEGGAPGSLLFTSTIALAETHQTSAGDVSFELASGQLVSVPQFAYQARLATPFAAQAGREYWISILALSPTAEPLWSWKSGTGGNKTCIQDFDGNRYTRDLDRAFSLESVAVPTVTVAATTAKANLAAGKAGVFTFKLSAAQGSPTVIDYTLKGTAVNGEDFDRLKDTVKFKTNTTTATVKIVPKGTLEGDASKTVKLVIDDNGAYKVGTKGAVTVTIAK